MSELLLRDATDGDEEAIREVTLAANVQYAAVSERLWDLYRSNILDTLADVRPAQQIVAERDGEVVGAVLLYPGATEFERADGSMFALDSFEVRLLAVTPAVRGEGMAQRLMEECIERARRAGASAVTLHTTDFMEAAIRLYVRMGFVRAPELDFEAAPNLIVKGYRYDLT